MSTKGYTVFGWVVWHIATFIAKWKMGKYNAKAGAAGVVALVLVGGVVAARAGSGD